MTAKSYSRSGVGFGWLALGFSLVLPMAGPAITKVTVSNRVTGVPVATYGHTTESSSNAPVADAYTTNATGAIWWMWTDGTASTFGRAEVGRLQLNTAADAAAQMTSPGTVATSVAQARTTASWTDTFTVNSSSQPVGKLGQMTVNFLIDGNLALASQPPGSSVYLRVLIRINDSYGADTTFAGGTQIKVANDGTVQTLPMDGRLVGPGLWPIQFQFHFGRPTYVMGWAEVYADARAEAISVAQGVLYGQATSDFGHTAVWAGISDISLPEGAPVTDATIVADSGYDYLLGTITAPAITRIQRLAQGLALEWTDLGQRSYTVETTPTLPTGNWTPVQGVAWPIQTNTVRLPLPGPSAAFFRVKVQ